MQDKNDNWSLEMANFLGATSLIASISYLRIG